jgi:hypothetical protein
VTFCPIWESVDATTGGRRCEYDDRCDCALGGDGPAGGFVYLLDENGAVLTMLSPVLGAEWMAKIAEGYLRDGG